MAGKWGSFRKGKNTSERNVVTSGGIDIDTQKRGSDAGSVFYGMYGEDNDTEVLNGNTGEICRMFLNNITTGENYSLRFRQSIGIGRAQGVRSMESFLTLSGDMRISNFHCRLFAEDGRIYIEDMESSNHTYVNEQRITKPHILVSGDIIRIGDTRLRVSM